MWHSLRDVAYLRAPDGLNVETAEASCRVCYRCKGPNRLLRGARPLSLAPIAYRSGVVPQPATLGDRDFRFVVSARPWVRPAGCVPASPHRMSPVNIVL